MGRGQRGKPFPADSALAALNTEGPWFRWDGSDLVIRVHVQPRASREGFAGVTAHGLKVRLTAPPVEGEANEALRNLLAAAFGVPKTGISLERGASGRHKQVRIRSPRRIPAELDINK